MAHVVFISHSSKDKTIADAVCTHLEARNIPCWIAPRDVRPGSPYSEEIIDGIENARVMVLVLSGNANASAHIAKEIERAVSHGIPVIPLRVEAVMPGKALDYFISSVHWLDAVTPPLEQHLETLANTILTVIKDKAPEAAKPAPVAASVQTLAPPASAAPSTPLQAGKRVGDYEILGELGSGGMGRVYRVRNVISNRIEAMKILLPDLAGRQELAERFLREIKVLASLDHPNIAALRTALTIDNQLVMIMEYVEGATLAQRLERGPIPVPDALNYVDQVLNALSYAHQHGVIHRDIKPANMMLTPQGVVKLMDFGIARSSGDSGLTMTGTTLGSINYMSPEQVRGEPADARSDLYSVGISLYEMVTGQRPFEAASDFSIMTAHVKDEPKPPQELQPGLPPALNEIILMAIAKDPARRFQTADAFRNALSSVRPQAPLAQPVTQSTRPATLVETAVSAAVPLAVTPRTPPPAPVQTPVEAKLTPVPQMPQPSAVPMPPSPSHRGLYMTLGALIVLAGLVLAGIYWPGRGKAQTEASKTTPPASAVASQPNTPPEPPSVPATTATATSPTTAGSNVEAMPGQSAALPPVPAKNAMPETMNAKPSAAKPPVQAAGLRQAIPLPKNAQQAMPQAAEPSAPRANPQELDEVEHRVDQLTSRAAAVNSSLNVMQQQQAAAGYGLRGDMAARQASMRLNIQKAQAAVEHGDIERAKRYADLAEADLAVLEHFLGR